MTAKSLCKLLNVHRHRLLQKLDVLRFTNSYKNTLESLESELSDGFIVIICHVLYDDWEKRLAEGSKSSSHVLTDLRKDGKGTSLTYKCFGINGDSLFTQSLDLNLNIHVIVG